MIEKPVDIRRSLGLGIFLDTRIIELPGDRVFGIYPNRIFRASRMILEMRDEED